jgi:hypothetical protein
MLSFLMIMIMKNLYLMHFKSCIIPCVIPIVCFLHWNNKLKKGLISYFKTSGITCLKKHVDANHSLVFQKIGKEKEIWRDNMLRKEKM